MNGPIFRRALFEPHVGSNFTVQGDDGTTSTLVLGRVKALPSSAAQEQYSLYFLAQPEVAATQGTYMLHHEVLGVLALFLVPVRPVEDAVEFEACFNHLVPDA